MCETGALPFPKCVMYYKYPHSDTEPKIIRERAMQQAFFKVHVVIMNEREVTLAWGKEQVAKRIC